MAMKWLGSSWGDQKTAAKLVSIESCGNFQMRSQRWSAGEQGFRPIAQFLPTTTGRHSDQQRRTDQLQAFGPDFARKYQTTVCSQHVGRLLDQQAGDRSHARTRKRSHCQHFLHCRNGWQRVSDGLLVKKKGWKTNLSTINWTIRFFKLSASKFALIGFAEALRMELRLDGYEDIKVTTICPLAMNTGMFKKPKSR